MLNKNPGFTLIELMVVVSIIAVLSTIGLTVYTGALARAREAKVRADFHAIDDQIHLARAAGDKYLWQITGFDQSDVSCRNQSLDAGPCIGQILTGWNNLKTYVGGQAMDLPKDPWGHYYVWDENEQEQTFAYDPPPAPPTTHVYCRWDILKSAGPDGFLSQTDPPGVTSTDDYIYYVTPKDCPNKEEKYCTPGKVMGGYRGPDPLAKTCS